MKSLTVAFDIDDTLYKIIQGCPENCPLRHHPHASPRQVPDYELIQVLKWFHYNGNEVIVWSAGGVGYAEMVVDKLGLTPYVDKILPKGCMTVDITFDDQSVKTGRANVKVKRDEHNFS